MKEWISVEDRFPESPENCLVCNMNECGDVWDSYAVAYCSNNKWKPVVDMLRAYNYDGIAHIELDESVTHWMPLPEPPK